MTGRILEALASLMKASNRGAVRRRPGGPRLSAPRRASRRTPGPQPSRPRAPAMRRGAAARRSCRTKGCMRPLMRHDRSALESGFPFACTERSGRGQRQRRRPIRCRDSLQGTADGTARWPAALLATRLSSGPTRRLPRWRPMRSRMPTSPWPLFAPLMPAGQSVRRRGSQASASAPNTRAGLNATGVPEHTRAPGPRTVTQPSSARS